MIGLEFSPKAWIILFEGIEGMGIQGDDLFYSKPLE